MKRKRDEAVKVPYEKRAFSLVVIILNVILLVFSVLCVSRYTQEYQRRLQEENLGNIANLNQSAALNATALISSWSIKLKDIARYIDRNDLTHDEALTVIEESNSNDERQFELIGSDYSGYLARRGDDGQFVPVSYAKSSYSELQKAFDDVNDDAYADVCFTPEFTESASALKYFAIYKHLPLADETGAVQTYTLLLAYRSSELLAVFNGVNDFTGQSTVLIGPKGNYIVSNADFKSDNFFQYLYVYNDLTLDERNAITQELRDNGSGELYYKNAAGQDCVFRYERMTTNGWYCVTCVPIEAFRVLIMGYDYVLYSVIALLITFAMDVAWLLIMNNRLRASMHREKEASEAKTDFLSRMSHDIRTPLNGIIGLTTLAKDEPNPPTTQEYLENIKVSGQFLTGLVNDILDMSKVESGKVELHPEPYSSGDLCKYIAAVVAPLCAEKGLEFRVSHPDETTPVMLDRLRFNQVMFNLLSNAVKYTPAGGRVELDWTRRELPDDRVAFDFTVRDNGVGMSEEFQKHMFESFSQENAQTATTGAGLGLSIVNSLVKLMGGTISVQSRKGEGSTFVVHLETDVCRGVQSAGPEAGAAELTGRRALLCEDNQINTMVAKRMLEKWGMEVTSVENGRLGVEAFTASDPGFFDIILMDVMMPEMDGLTATRLIRAAQRPDSSLPIVAMTANAYDTDVKNCIDSGMSAHMGKPIDAEQLKETMARLIRDEAHSD